MSSLSWVANEIPDLKGKTVIVTGANSGIGYEAALQLARKGARTIMACRSMNKGESAIAKVRAQYPNADVALEALDLADLASVRDFAARFTAEHARLDVLINNAGVMALPYRKTADGFEMQLGTNHFGHFALTGLLLDHLRAAVSETGQARVVNVSSIAHRVGKIRFDDLQSEKSYSKWRAYGQSKLANLLFTYELQRRLNRAREDDLLSVACHPGYSGTNLQVAGAQMSGSVLMEKISLLGNKLISQSAAMGALPTLYAATAPNVSSGEYFGPNGMGEMTGYPKKVNSTERSRNAQDASRLWEISAKLTQVDFGGLA